MNKVKIFYDVETTGLRPNRHSIVQLAGIVEVNDEAVEEFDLKMAPHPKAEIEPGALRVTKRTVEELRGFPDLEDSFSGFIEILNRYVDPYKKYGKAWLVGYNNRSFDDHFLAKTFDLCGNSFYGGYFFADSKDVIVLASEYLEDRRRTMPSFKLKRVAMELGIPFDPDGLHDALFDARITREIYRIVTGREVEI